MACLFLDEMPEFPRNVLEQLRQPLENHSVTLGPSGDDAFVSRPLHVGRRDESLPLRVLRDTTKECRCTGAIIQRDTSGKISGPLLDRIDLHMEVPAVAYKEFRSNMRGVSSAEMRERVGLARRLQQNAGFYNAHIPNRQLREFCALDEAGERTLEMAVRRMSFRPARMTGS